MKTMSATATLQLRAPRWAAPEQARSLPSGEWTTYSSDEGQS